MIASVFELYGALCFLSLIAFLVLAARAKLRPDLDEDEFDIGELATRAVRQHSSGRGPGPQGIVTIGPAPPGQAWQASDPKASAPDPYAKAPHDLNSRHDRRSRR